MLLVLVVVCIGLYLASPPRLVPTPVRTEFTPWPVADLPCHVYRTGAITPARVTFQIPLTPTADPCVWEYIPIYPPAGMPPTYRVHFPAPVTAPPATVAGTAEMVEIDMRRRLNGVPGVLIFRVAPSPP